MTFRELLTSRRAVVWLAAAVVLAVAVGALVAPWPARLGDRATGDRALAAQVRASTSGQGRMGVSVAVLDRGELRRAGLGDVGVDTQVEIGSVTKTLTASLLADLAADGVVDPGDKVREVLPDREWKRGGVGDVTLAELASQRSGLPRAPLTPKTYVGALGYTFLGIDPGVASPEEVVDAAASAPRVTPGTYAYSNLGFAFLGQVLAAKVGTPYPQLLRERVLDPVGMDATAIPSTADDVPRGAAPGHDGIGRRVAPSVNLGDAPAGAGVWSTTGDLVRFADQVRRGKAPGADAAKPRYSAGSVGRIGYAWNTSKVGGRTIVWHNGLSGGCTAFLGFDREAQRVVAVLSDTDVDVDGLGVRLLTGVDAWGDDPPRLPAILVGVALPPAGGLTLLATTLGGWRRAGRRDPDRATILGSAGWTLFAFAVTYAAGALGGWTIAGWLVGAALVGVAGFVTVARWRRLGWNTAHRPRLHWTGTAVGVLLGLATAVMVAS